MVTNPEMQALLSAIEALDPDEREKGADEVTDICRSFSPEQAALLAERLVAIRLREAIETCQEAQLNALCDIKAWHEVPGPVFAKLSPLLDGDVGAQREYLQELLADDASSTPPCQ
jgi:hypothetical protein